MITIENEIAIFATVLETAETEKTSSFTTTLCQKASVLFHGRGDAIGIIS